MIGLSDEVTEIVEDIVTLFEYNHSIVIGEDEAVLTKLEQVVKLALLRHYSKSTKNDLVDAEEDEDDIIYQEDMDVFPADPDEE